jgi:hypothetical protein
VLIFELFYPLNEYYILVHGNTTKDEHQHFRRKRRIEPAQLTVKGLHFVQETSPAEIGAALADFVRGLRGR